MKCDAHVGSVLQALVSGLLPDRAACCKAKRWNAWTMSMLTGHGMTVCDLLVSFKSFQCGRDWLPYAAVPATEAEKVQGKLSSTSSPGPWWQVK